MIFLSEFIEWVACLTEIGLLSWLFWEAFKKQRKNAGIYWDYIYVVCMATWVLFINNIVLYSSFTLVQLVVISSMVARALYRVSYRKLLSVLYVLFLQHRHVGKQSLSLSWRPMEYKW